MLHKLKSLQTKVLLISVCFFGLFGVINLLVMYYIVYPSFISLELDEAGKNLNRAAATIRNSTSNLVNTCRDWATWDDTYDFIQTGSDRFIEANLVKNAYENNKIHLISFFDTKGEIVWAEAYSDTYDDRIQPAELNQGSLAPSHPFFSYDTKNTPLRQTDVRGIWTTEFGPMLIASLPILTSNGEGPVTGTLVMGRFLDKTLVERLSALVQVGFDIQPYNGGIVPAAARQYGKLTVNDTDIWIARQDEKLLSAYTVFADILGRQALVIKADTPRDISAEGRTAIRYAVVSGLIGIIGILVVLVLLLRQTVLKPITRLKAYVLNFGASGASAPRLTVRRNDEIGTLGVEFDKLLSQLDTKASELALLNDELTRDIEKRKAAEEALRAGEERFRSYVENASDIIYTMNTEGIYTYITPNVEAVFGYKDTELIGKSFKNIWHPDDVGKRDEYLESVLRGEKVEPPSHRVIDKEGNCLWFTTNISTMKNQDGELEFLGIVRNINKQMMMIKEREALQERLARSRKMEALGLLAGGVAHDLNNVLSGIVSYPELLLLNLPEKSSLRKPLLTIRESGQKAAEIVQDLLTLARRGVMNAQVLNLNYIVSDYLNSPEYEKLLSFHPGTEISVSLADDLRNIHGSSIHLRKTIMNLVSNAAEAQPSGGHISVSTLNQYLDRPLKGYDTIAAGDYAVVRVSDKGIGIHPEDIGRIFEPFYTKKVMGRSGTGLGMTVVWGTVQDHNGYIDIESTQGKGTTFSLFFPVTHETIFSSTGTFRMEDFKGTGKTVLVVDDMEEQRLIASGILTKAGYRVETVSSGEEALRYLSGNAVDLLVLDMIMDPGMDGLSTYEKILEMHPGQKAIIASGFSETDRVKETLRLGANAYLRKPYTLEKILRAAATALKE